MIPIEDYKVYIQEKRMNLIIEDQEAILEEAELTAQQVIDDHLYPYYDTTTIFAALNTYRSVKRWVMVIAIYFVYERIPDALVPDRVVKNYDDVMRTLININDGKGSVNLPRLTSSEGGTEKPETKFRWGSEAKRVHS
jgi:hypothetical protein